MSLSSIAVLYAAMTAVNADTNTIAHITIADMPLLFTCLKKERC